MSNAGNVGNAALSAAGQQNSAYGGAANVLGRIYGRQGGGSNPYFNAAKANMTGDFGNVYGFGGGGGVPSYDITTPGFYE
jgi:hypothetical protein